MRKCKKHDIELDSYEVPAHGTDYYCSQCDKEWYEEYDKRKKERMKEREQ